MNVLLILLVLLLVFVVNDAIDDKTCSSSSSSSSSCNDNLPLTKSIVGANKQYALIASSMRRKNLLVVNVDVYRVGIYASSSLETIVKNNIKAGKSYGLASKSGDEISLSLYLKFVRSVTTDKILEAFRTGLSSVADKTAVNSFSDILFKKIGKIGTKKDDTIEFIFKGRNNEEIGILVRDDKVPEIIKSAALREKLIEIYTGADSIVPDLPKQLEKKYK